MKHGDFDLRWHSYEPCRLLPHTAIAKLSSAIPALFNDQPVTAFRTDVCPDPLEEDADPQAALSQKLHVDQCPDKPGEETTYPDTPALQHGKIFADYGKVALVEVTKRGKRWFLGHLPKD